MITRNHRQESLSRAYVQAVAARAGVICSVPDLDYGIDLTLRLVDETNSFVDAGVLLDLQLKATTLADTTDPTTIGYDLRVSDYDKLRPEVPVPRILVVLELPTDESEWITLTTNELILRRAAFWASLRGHAPTTTKSTTRVRLAGKPCYPICTHRVTRPGSGGRCPVTIRFQNPWIDPRVLSVRPADAEAYLRSHGWQEADSGSPHWKRFLSPANGEREAVLVPTNTNDDSLVNLLVECIGKVAAWENRFAGELLGELLADSTGIHSNGAPNSHSGATH